MWDLGSRVSGVRFGVSSLGFRVPEMDTRRRASTRIVIGSAILGTPPIYGGVRGLGLRV